MAIKDFQSKQQQFDIYDKVVEDFLKPENTASERKMRMMKGTPQEIPEDIADLGPVLAKPYDFERLVELARARARTGLFSRLRRD